MLKYLGAAIRATLPVTLAGVAIGAALAFVHAVFPVVAVGLVGGILLALAANQRFRALVDARALQARKDAAEDPRNLLDALPPGHKNRIVLLENRLQEIVTRQREGGAGESAIETTTVALQGLLHTAIRLLRYRSEMEKAQREVNPAALERDVEQSDDARIRDSARRRLANYQKRKDELGRAEADMKRIEAEFELILEESARAPERPPAVGERIELTSEALRDPLADAPSDVDAPGERTESEPVTPRKELE